MIVVHHPHREEKPMPILLKSITALACCAVATMAALTVAHADVSGSVPGNDVTPPTTTTMDRDPHSFTAVQPSSICGDDTLACAPAHTH